MELTSINKELLESSKRLKDASNELFKLAKEKAETERDYRIALHKAIMKLKADNERATLIPDLARGAVADKKFARDLADTLWQACRENTDSIKTQISALQTIVKHQTEY